MTKEKLLEKTLAANENFRYIKECTEQSQNEAFSKIDDVTANVRSKIKVWQGALDTESKVMAAAKAFKDAIEDLHNQEIASVEKEFFDLAYKYFNDPELS